MTAKPHSLRCRIRWVRRSLRRRHDTLAPCIRERIVLAALVLLLFLYLWLLFAADMGSELEIGHPEYKTVSVKNLENGEIFEEKYDKLILSPGAKPTQPRLPGVGIDKLFTLRTVEDTFRIKEYINKNHPKSAVLAGGGFIGLELAENLRELGMDVTIVQRPKQLMNPFDPDMASMIHNEMRKHGIKLVLGYTVEGFKEKDNGLSSSIPDAS